MEDDKGGKFCHCLRQTIWSIAVRSMWILGKSDGNRHVGSHACNFRKRRPIVDRI